MKNKKIFINGNFGYKNNHLDGQTIKTRMIKDELVTEFGDENVNYVDTSYFSSNKIKTLFQLVQGFLANDTIIFMPDMRAFKLLLPIITFVSFFKKIEKRYIVIGGWLPRYLKTNNRYLDMLLKFDGVYVETTKMVKDLESLGLNNIFHFLNFRNFNINRNKEYREIKAPLKLVMLSRVLPEKGIELAIDAVNNINRKNDEYLILDIYGPIQSTYEARFLEIMKKQNDSINYYGPINPEKITKTLEEYDVLLFPTYFKAEGLPGTIIDAYIAGLPVIASNWAYNKEFVKHNQTGKLIEPKSVEELENAILFFIDNPEKVLDFGIKSSKEAEKFHKDNVMKILTSHIKER